MTKVNEEILSDDQLKLKLDRSRWYLLQKYAFYGAPLCNLKDVLVTSLPTAATDGKRIYWGRKFLSKLDDQEVRFVHLHELLHNLHLHLWRLPRTREGNIAGDFVINLVLQGMDGVRMPKEGLLDHQYDNMAEEEVLHRLPKQPKRDGEGGCGGIPGDGQPGDGESIECDDAGGCGGFVDPADKKDGDGDNDGDKKVPRGGKEDPNAPDTTETLRDRWERALVQAEISAKVLKQGNLPGNLERILQRIKAQDIDWRQETSEFVRDSIGTRNDWTRAAKRHAYQPVVYPRKRKDHLGKIVFVRDTSGSVCDQELAEYTDLINSCITENDCEGLVMDCDTHIRKEYNISTGEPCPPHAVGGGGTDFRGPFIKAQEIVDDGEEIAGLIYITDLCGTFPPVAPEFPVLWIVSGRYGDSSAVAPFGRTVHLLR